MKNKKITSEEKLIAKKLKKAQMSASKKHALAAPGKLQKKIIGDKLENLLINLYPELKEKSLRERIKQATKILTGKVQKSEIRSVKKSAAEIVKNLTSSHDSVSAEV